MYIQESCFPYWPVAEEIVKFGEYLVQIKMVRNEKKYTQRNFKVTMEVTIETFSC